MSFTSSLVVAASLLFPPPPAPSGPIMLRGEVVDEFDDDRLLLAIGYEDGARKGLRGNLDRVEHVGSQRKLDFTRPRWAVEFVEVGVKFTVAKRVDDKRAFNADWGRRFHRGDSVIWLTLEPLPSPGPIENPWIDGRSRLLPGGAIIDLTRPK